MSESGKTSKKLNSQNNFNFVDSKKSLKTDNNREQSEIDENIHNIILSNFESQNLKVINEKDEGELQLTDSILMELEDINSAKNSLKKDGRNSPMDLDLNGFDFSEILKSQVKLKSPVVQKRNLSSEEKYVKDNFDISNFNFSNNENNFNISEADLKNIAENMHSHNLVRERTPVKNFQDQRKDNINTTENVHNGKKFNKNEKISDNLQIFHSESVNSTTIITDSLKHPVNNNTSKCNNPKNIQNFHKNNFTNSNNINQSLCGSNQNLNSGNDLNLNRFQSEFEGFMRTSLNFFNFFREKVEEIETIKTQVNKLESVSNNLLSNRCISQHGCCRCTCPNSNSSMNHSSNNNNNNNNFSNENGLKLFTNEIKIFFGSNEQVSPNQKTSILKNSKEFFSQIDDLEAINLNLSLNTKNIMSHINHINNTMNNNINSQNALTHDNSRSGFKVGVKKEEINDIEEEKKNFTIVNTINRSSDSFSRKNKQNFDFNSNNPMFTKLEEDNLTLLDVNSRNDFIKIQDEEFDQILQNAKKKINKNIPSNNHFNNVKGKKLEIEKTCKNLSENIESTCYEINSKMDMKNIQDEEFDQILKNKTKINTNNLEMSFTKANNLGKFDESKFQERQGNSNIDILESDIKPQDINDAEFDDMLNMLKKNKKIKTSDLNMEFSTGNNIPKSSHAQHAKNSNYPTYSKNETFTSDFLCNDNPLKFKTNERTLKLMFEMEMDPVDEINDVPEEEIQKELIGNKKDKSNYSSNLMNKGVKAMNYNKHDNNITVSIKPEVGVKRNFADHSKALSNSGIFVNNASSSDVSVRPKKIQKTGQGFKIDKNNTSSAHGNHNNPNSNKTTTVKLNSNSNINNPITSNQIYPSHNDSIQNSSCNKNPLINLTELKEKIKQLQENSFQYLSPSFADKFQFICVCMNKFLEVSNNVITENELSKSLEDTCSICKDKKIITIENFSSSFSAYFRIVSSPKSNPEKEKEIEIFLRYQYRYATWKYYLISKASENRKDLSILNIFDHTYKKFKIIFEEGKRSFLTKVAEKDSSINKYMTLQIFDIKKTKNQNSQCYTLELTDGYKSVYSEITNTNPISSLINNSLIYPGMKLDIGLAKIEKVTNEFEIFIQIHYNSISKADLASKLGQSKDKRFLLKNLGNLREDGGEVSLIDVFVLKKYDYYVYDYNKKKKFSRNKFEKIIEQVKEDAEKRQVYSLHKEDVSYENYEEETNIRLTDKNLSKKNVNSENLNNVKGLKRLNNEKNLRVKREDENFPNQNQKSPYEGISYTFKIVCVDSLLYYNYLNEIGKKSTDAKENFEINMKKSLKAKLMKKCVIEFHTKNLNPFENISGGTRYQFALLNKMKNNQNFNSYDPKNLNLKGNDSTSIKEIKLEYKKSDSIYQNFFNELTKCTETKSEDVDISEYLISNNFNYSKINNEEFSYVGIYLNRYVNVKLNSADDSKDPEKFLFFVNKDNCMAIIKIHDENFFDMTKFTCAKSNSNSCQIFHFSNLNFQILYYFDDFSTKSLTTFKGEKLNDQNFANKYVVIFLQTTPYTSFKIANNGTKHLTELKSRISESNSEKIKIYDEALLDDVIKSIS